MASYKKNRNYKKSPTKIPAKIKRLVRQIKKAFIAIIEKSDINALDILFEKLMSGMINHFMIFDKSLLKKFLSSSNQLFKNACNKKGEKFEDLRKISLSYINKTIKMEYHIPQPTISVLEEDERDGGKISRNFFKSQTLIKNITKKLNVYKQPTKKDAMKLLQNAIKSIPMMLELYRISPKEKKDFQKLCYDRTWKSRNILHTAHTLAQKIKSSFESLRYICGLYQALFDLFKGELQKNIDESYFNPEFNVFDEFYSSRRKRRKFKEMDNLRTILENEMQISIKELFDWIFDESEIRFFRNKESHNLDDVEQDKLQEGLYAYYSKTGPKYIEIKKLYCIQNDLYFLFRLVGFLITSNILKVAIKYDI